MELKPSEMLEQLRLSHVFDREQLDCLTRQIAACRTGSTNDLVQQWIREETLTDFQANKILTRQAASLVIGPYVLLRPLANGGMGQVYLAYHYKHRERLVALKLMGTSFSDHLGYLKRFKREVDLLRSLNHPYIVSVIDSGNSGNGMPHSVSAPYLVTEFVEGPTLREYVAERGPINWSKALGIMRQLLIALEHAHQSHVLHRDIKPSNIILHPQGNIKLLDFGLGSSLSSAQSVSKLTMTGDVLGTIDFAAPEQATGGKATIQSDIYSVGCTLYYCLVGQPPYLRRSSMEVARAHCFAPLPILPFGVGGPLGLQNLINGLLAKSPSDRIPNACQVRLEIDTLLASADSDELAEGVQLPVEPELDSGSEAVYRDWQLPPLSSDRDTP